MKHENVTELIIKAFYAVYNTLGYGFLEKVYENAMAIELGELGLKAVQQAPIVVHYHKHQVGYYNADLLVEDVVIVKLKATQALTPAYEAQLLNYLKATTYKVGLLLNYIGKLFLE